MKNNVNKKDVWHLITIDTRSNVSDKLIAVLIESISKCIHINYAVIDDINGHGKYGLISELVEIQNQILDIDFLLKKITGISCFEWGDFFLFETYPDTWNNPSNELYPFVVKQTDVTVRSIDGQYIYVYTKHELVAQQIIAHFSIESHRIDTLDKLDFPE